MAEHEIQSTDPGYLVLPDATLKYVIQYTEWCVAGGYQRYRGWNEYYRYDRYRDVLKSVNPSANHRITHIDLGCGSGLFAWVLLDWANKQGIGYNRIDLYGYDHCMEMIRLAWMIRNRLLRYSIGYPTLRYHHDSTKLLRQLTANLHQDSDCIITLGYVLAGNHQDSDIDCFTQIIKFVSDTKGDDTTCFLLASDAIYQGDFKAGWGKLKQELQAGDVVCMEVPTGTIYSGDRCVLLSRREV